jgi:Predicted membrane protein
MKKTTAKDKSKRQTYVSQLFRFMTGIFIGSGFILPGISGGALAAVFGIYERIISFLADIRKDFKKNLIFFIPVGIGGIVGIVGFSALTKLFFGNDLEPYTLWFFIGCIIGTLPTLLRQAQKESKKRSNLKTTAVAFVVSLGVLILLNYFLPEGNLPQNIFTWAFCGILIGLGVIVPGLSPSNLLLFLGMYPSMLEGIGKFDLLVIIPIVIGAFACVISMSRLMKKVLEKFYTVTFHIILGIVIASTVMIIPLPINYPDFTYLSPMVLIIIPVTAAGIALGYWMSLLEKKYKS